MEPLYILLIFCSAISFFILFIYRKKIRTRYQDPIFLEKLVSVKNFLKEINNLEDYVTWKQRDDILRRYKSAYDFFGGKTRYYSKEGCISKFNNTYENFYNFIKEYNNNYVEKTIEENNSFFEIEGNKLDEQQCRAIVVDEYSNLVVAGAGSGKTLTILGKVKFLTEKKHINPNKILLMSYTRKTVDDLNTRLKTILPGAQATTFHKLGLDVIAECDGGRPKIAKESVLRSVVRDYLKNEISSHPNQVDALVEFVACYSNIPEDYENFNSPGERFDHYKGSVDYETLRSKVNKAGGLKNSSTLAGETVNSIEELMIANFLYLNGVKYEYEKLYPYSSFTYHPDFYLTDYDIWFEHFGVDENDEANWLESDFEKRQYTERMYEKRELHKKHGTKLLETYSYYNRRHILLDELKNMLLENGVELRRIDMNKVYRAISKDRYFGYQLEDLIITFINLCKSKDLSECEIEQLFSNERKDDFMTKRSRLFFAFAFPVLRRYQQTLDDAKSIDFHDMINRAAKIVTKHGYYNKYDYVIIDEYQDISYSRFHLMDAIRKYSDAKLLCVGDDWQSIYRFAGSDISLFSSFGDFVGEYEQLLIEQTYRNSSELVDVAAHFIQKNPSQIKKEPKSDKTLNNPIKLVQYDAADEENLYNLFINTVRNLVECYGVDKSIMILGRHSFDIDPILYEGPGKTQKRRGIRMDDNGRIIIKSLEYNNLTFTSVHKSKGLQADNVIVLNMENSQYGFPNKLTDDPILTPLLSVEEDFRYAEERRLFYVALTRTKNEVVLISPNVNESEFFIELLNDNSFVLTSGSTLGKQVNCPWCKTGKLVVRRNGKTGEQFLGCTNFPQCNQSYKETNILEHPIKCQKCGSGFMVKRNGTYGEFLGCTNWRSNGKGCTNTISMDRR